MKIIAMERADGGVSIVRPNFAHIFGLQAGLPPETINDLQRMTFGIPADQIAALEKAFTNVGKDVEIKTGQPGGVTLRSTKLAVLISTEDAINGYAAHRLKNDLDSEGKPLFKRFVLIEERSLPSRDSRDSWRLAGDKVVAQ